MEIVYTFLKYVLSTAICFAAAKLFTTFIPKDSVVVCIAGVLLASSTFIHIVICFYIKLRIKRENSVKKFYLDKDRSKEMTYA